MRNVTRFGSGLVCLTAFLVAQSFGQSPASTTPEVQKAAAQLSQPAGPPSQQAQTDTTNLQADRTTVPGYGANSNSGLDNRPVQRIYENSAAMGDRSMLAPMRDAQADNSSMAGQRENGMSNSASGQQRGEIGVWMIENGGQGVRVGRLARGGAADRAGLRSGDIILQVNGNDVASPMTAAQQIRGIPIGQAATLTVVRDGAQQQLQVTLAAARPGQSYQVGYGGESENGGDRAMSGERNGNGLAARTARLEQQMESMTKEMRQMREQMSSMKMSGASSTGIEQSGAGIGPTPSAASPTSNSLTPPQSSTGSAAPSTNPSTSAMPTPAAGTSSTGSSPASGTNSGTSGTDTQDLFGTGAGTSSSGSTGASSAGGASR